MTLTAWSGLIGSFWFWLDSVYELFKYNGALIINKHLTEVISSWGRTYTVWERAGFSHNSLPSSELHNNISSLNLQQPSVVVSHPSNTNRPRFSKWQTQLWVVVQEFQLIQRPWLKMLRNYISIRLPMVSLHYTIGIWVKFPSPVPALSALVWDMLLTSGEEVRMQ